MSTDLIQYLFPVDATEYRDGWFEVERRLMADYHDRMGACLADQGHLSIGGLLSVAPQTEIVDVWRFPDPGLELAGFIRAEPAAIFNLLGHAEPGINIDSPDHLMVQELGRHPEYDAGSSVIDADRLNSSISECIDQVGMSEEAEIAMSIRRRWFLALDGVDEDAQLASPMAASLDCIGAQVLGGDRVESVEQAQQALQAHIAQLESQAPPELERLASSGATYWECIRELESGRVPLRIAARQAMIDENPSILARLDAALTS